MALSETVKSSLRDAQEDLKNALACAARTEKPFISKNIADMIAPVSYTHLTLPTSDLV